MKRDPCVEVAHQVRNALSCERGLIIEAQSILGKMLHRCQGTMDGLQSLIDTARQSVRILDPACSYEIRSDACGDGAFGARRKHGDETYEHRGLDTICTPGQVVIAPMDGLISRIGWCYADEAYRLLVIESDPWACRILYLQPSAGIEGRWVRQGQVIGHAQDIRGRDDYRKQGMLPHLHTELCLGEDLVDPALFMRINQCGS